MSDGFSPYKEICANPQCGHDKRTHHFDIKGPGDCLGMLCTCKGYVDANARGGQARAPAAGYRG